MRWGPRFVAVLILSCATTFAFGAPTEGQGCHPSYEGACLDPSASDYDCAGGGGNGPLYVDRTVRVVGPDEFGLDDDNDGLGCDLLGAAPNEPTDDDAAAVAGGREPREPRTPRQPGERTAERPAVRDAPTRRTDRGLPATGSPAAGFALVGLGLVSLGVGLLVIAGRFDRGSLAAERVVYRTSVVGQREPSLDDVLALRLIAMGLVVTGFIATFFAATA